MIKICLLIFMFVFQFSPNAQAQEHLYATWDTLEVDTVASAWLIKRFIDPEAVFKFFKKGEFITEGIAFDTPDASFQRTAKQSTFESLLSAYKIHDKVVLEVGEIIYDIEVNYWAEPLRKESSSLKQTIRAIIKNAATPEECLERSFPVFDELYAALEKKE